MQSSSPFNTESTTQKKVVYNYKTEKGIYNDNTNTVELVVSPNNNFFMLEDGEMQSYTAKNIYFTKLIHYIDGQDLIGEVVVEHEAGVYTVFPLKSGASYETEIDRIIDSGTSTDYQDITLNDMIPRQTNCKYYYTSDYSVYFFDQPIEINTEPTIDNDPSGLSTYVNETTGITYELIPQANISMQSDDDIYIDCSPTGASQEELDTYAVPINSRMNSDLGQKRMEEMITNFFFFMILVGIAYFVSPSLYKMFIVDYILLKFYVDGVNRNQISANPILMLHSYRKALDILVLGFCVVLFCLLMGTNGGILVGTIFAVFIFLSMAVIRDKMNLKENQQVKTNGGKTYSMFDDDPKNEKTGQANIPIVGSIFIDIAGNALSSNVGVGVSLTFIIISIILIALYIKGGLAITITLLICIFIGLTTGIQIDLRNVSVNDKPDSRVKTSDSAVDGFIKAFNNANTPIASEEE